MPSTNHPFFFPLLKKMIIVTLRERNTNKITGKDKEWISQKSGIKKSYCERILVHGVYSSEAAGVSVGEDTLDKFVSCLPEEWGYESWDAFCLREQERMKDTELIYELTDKNFRMQSERIQERIRREIEGRAKQYIQELIQALSQKKEGKGIHESSSPNIAKEERKKVLGSKDQSERKITGWKKIIPFLMLPIFILVFFINRGEDEQKTDEEAIAIEKVIRQSIYMEMEAYKHVENYEPYIDSLAQLFYPSSLNKIMKIVKRRHLWEHTLNNDNNPSYAQCINVSIDRIGNDGVAHAQTLEDWLVVWFDTKEKKDAYTYDVTNQQTYHLKKDSIGSWKIITNDYSGNAPKSLPTLYVYDSLRSQIELPWKDFKLNFIEALTKGNVEKALAMIRFYLEFKNPEHFNAMQEYLEIIKIEASFREAQRHLNLKKSTAKPFEESKQEAIENVYKLFISL